MEIKIGEITTSVILGQTVKAQEVDNKRSRCLGCAFYGLCNGEPPFFHLRRMDVGNCTGHKRKDKKNIRFVTVNSLYDIPNKIKNEVVRILLSDENDKTIKAFTFLTGLYKGLVDADFVRTTKKPGEIIISKLLGEELIIKSCPDEWRGGRCAGCSYQYVCLTDENKSLFRIRQCEAGHCSKNSRDDKINVYFESIKHLYTPDQDSINDIREIEHSSSLDRLEKDKLIRDILNSMYYRYV